jgi:DNA adenine methylase
MTVERPALRYFGGKWMLAPWVIEHFPPHRVYVEPFGGAASVLLRKPRSRTEVYNDLAGEVVNVFRVLRDPQTSARLRELLDLTPFSRAEFNDAHERSEDPIEQARRSIVRSFMGHGADSLTREHRSGFRAKSFGSSRDASKDWLNYPKQLVTYCDRLTGVIIENKDAKEVMTVNDTPETLHFVDPPYVFSARSDKRHGYRHELTDDDHLALCEFLQSLKGMVVLCGYPNPLYDRLGWKTVERKALADGAAERTEVLWMNPAAATAHVQQSLFEARR